MNNNKTIILHSGISIDFSIGKNAADNFRILDLAESHHLWFHIENASSCHIIAHIPSDINRKNIQYAIKQGAVLCKQHSRYANQKNVPIVYTKVQDIVKTNIIGSVQISNAKQIII